MWLLPMMVGLQNQYSHNGAYDKCICNYCVPLLRPKKNVLLKSETGTRGREGEKSSQREIKLSLIRVNPYRE